MKRLIYIATVLWVSIALSSCSRKEFAPMRHDSADSQLMKDIKDYLPGTIRVFDPAEFYSPGTKADCGLPVDIPSDALDYDNASTLSNSLYDYVQIPIHASTPLDYASVRFPLIPDGKAPSETAESKTFLIVQSPKDSAWTAAYTVTIFPHPDYMTPGQLDSLCFFYDGFFNAVFIYADLEGKVFKAETYLHGKLWKTGTVNTAASVSDSPAVYTDSDTVISSLTPLRSLFDDIIYDYMPAVVITADRIYKYDDWVFHTEDPDHSSNNLITNPNALIDNLTNPFGGGGGKDGQDNADRTYEVVIGKDGRGVTSGQGTYKVGTVVYCDAMPLYVGDIATSEFIHWSGHVSSTSPSITFTIPVEYVSLNPSISLTAHFHNFNPCADEENDRRDPLRQMRIQASGAGGWNIKGGTFGDDVRKDSRGNDVAHWGIDLACPVGTPVFATHNGTVSAIRNDISEDTTWDEYKKREDKDCESKRLFNAGNAVEIECYTNGGLYTIKYYHLTSVEGTLYIGKPVKAGDIIGISGITGNGGSKSSGGPHLHYQVNIGRSMNNRTNPEPFIYSKFDGKGLQTNPCNE